MTTSEAALARRLSNSAPVAGPGPAERNDVVTGTDTAIAGEGGTVQLAGTAGTHAVADPVANCVWLRVLDSVGAAHVLTGNFKQGGTDYSTLTFDSSLGSYCILTADDAAGWQVDTAIGVAIS